MDFLTLVQLTFNFLIHITPKHNCSNLFARVDLFWVFEMLVFNKVERL